MKITLGITESYTHEGFLIVKPYIKDVLNFIGLSVENGGGHSIGVVVDVIGRIDDPRLVVRLYNRDLGELVASRKETLYCAISPRKPKKRGRR
ncbi:MAG: RNA-binding protein [Desulfurococcaceae archaeon]